MHAGDAGRRLWAHLPPQKLPGVLGVNFLQVLTEQLCGQGLSRVRREPPGCGTCAPSSRGLRAVGELARGGRC